MFGDNCASNSLIASGITSGMSCSRREKCEEELHRYLQPKNKLSDKTLFRFKSKGDQRKNEPLSLSTSTVQQWWQKNKTEYPILAVLARQWLGCVGSSVPSERVFSTSGNIVTKKRAAIEPNLVRDMTFIAHNDRS